MRKIFKKACLIMGMCLLATSVMAAPAMAATYPCLFYGTAEVDGAPVAADTEVTAWVEGVQVGSALTGAGTLDPGQFTLQVELGGVAEVSFKIGELNAAETATWAQYGQVEVSLTASTGVTLVSIAVAPVSASVLVGETQAFTATGTYSDDTTADVTADAAWASSDTAVATIDGAIATAVAVGTTTITATLGSIDGSASLEVTESVEVVTVELLEGVNVVAYNGATTSLPDALSNIGPDGSAVVQVIWARADWTGGVWLYYNAAIPWGTLTELENGRAYIIVVSEACTWEIPQ